MGLLLSCDGGANTTPAATSTGSTHNAESNVAHAATPPPGDSAKPTPATTTAQTADGAVTYDFVDNRHLAHIYDQGLVLDMGSAGSLKYIQGSWNSPWYEGTKEAAFDFTYPKGVGGSVRFPLGAPGSTGKSTDGWVISLRLKPVGKQNADLFFRSASGEEKKIGSINGIAEGWNTHHVKLPAGYELGQEHTLRVHFSRSGDVGGGKKAAAAIDWIRVSPAQTDAEPGTATTIFDAKSRSVKLSPGQRVSWFTMPGKDQKFSAQVSGDAHLEITPYDGKTEVFKSSNGALTVDFQKFAGKPVKIEFANDSAQPASLTQPTLRTAPKPAVARAEPPKYILVWIIDTLRADHTQVYNPKTEVQTPNLVAYTKQAATFQSGTVQGNSSLPTSASIFSAAYSPNHGMITEKAKLPADHVVLGEPFDKAGWETALYSSNGYVSKSWGFSRGFDTEVNPIRENRPSDTEYLWPEAEAWLKKVVTEKPDKSALLYINTVDPHVPYDPPVSILKTYTSSSGTVGKVSPRGTGQLLHDMAGGKIKLSDAEATYMHDLYKGEITYNDLWFGKMLESLEAMGIRDKTMIVITSDHGEEFGEYGRWGHGISVNQELVDVPMIIGYTPWTKDGRLVSQDVEVVDILPTLLDATGLPQADSTQGDSLVDLILDPTERHPRAAFSYHNTFLRGARIGDWKYQLFNGDKDPVFHLTDGAGGWDKKDLADQQPLVRRMMRDAMAFQVGLDTKLNKITHGVANNHSAELATWLDSKGW